MRRNSIRTALALALALAVSCCASSCTAPTARSRVLWPAVVQAWPAVKEDVARGTMFDPALRTPELDAAVVAVDAAVSADDRHAVRGVDAALLERVALVGVHQRMQAGEVSAGVAASLSERVAKFREALEELSKP
jgi:hypothetical protein